MSTNQATTKQTNVRIRIRLKAFLSFSDQIDDQLRRLEDRILTAVPQLAHRKSVRSSIPRR
jgi:hypothetical protein